MCSSRRIRATRESAAEHGVRSRKMDRAEALSVLDRALSRYQAESHTELKRLVKKSEGVSMAGASGVEYQVKVRAAWEAGQNGPLRVFAAVDDGGWRALLPVSRAFIVTPEGKVTRA